MQQYIIYAWDGTDEEALERRMKSRPAHFEIARQMKAKGNFIAGGAILNDSGKMIGSMMIMQFSSPDELQQWMENEPYLTGNVWKKTEVHPFRLAEV
jgi:uncharacterized protein YciI